MTTYRIENTDSGVVLGYYKAATAQEAIDLMARDAGYADYAACCLATGETSALTASEVNLEYTEE